MPRPLHVLIEFQCPWAVTPEYYIGACMAEGFLAEFCNSCHDIDSFSHKQNKKRI